LAIALSIAQSANQRDFELFSSNFQLSRSANSCPHYFGQNARDQDPDCCLQYGVFNQFHPRWQRLITEFNAPSAICGYVSTALLHLVAQKDLKSENDVDQLKRQLCIFEDVEPLIRNSMSRIRTSKENYISSHMQDFPTPKSKNDYLKAWVANYEISDFLRELPEELRKCVVFLRINEYAEIDSATHEEKKTH